MKAITFLLHTQQPILATSFQGDPNSDVSYSYIPGSMIRGALISRYLKRHPELPEDILSDEKVNETVKRLFFDGSTRYLNAYLFSGKERTLPVPLSWYKQKGDELPKPDERDMPIYDLSQIDPNRLPENLSSPKLVNEKFCTVDGHAVVLYSEKRRMNIHNLRDRKKGRSVPTRRDLTTRQVIQKGEGEIFQYEALDAGQTFQGVILCEQMELETIQGLLKPPDIWLGGSKSAGYGHAKLEIQPPKDDWTEVGIKLHNRAAREHLTITLLSETILRNDSGQHVADPSLVKQAIEEKIEDKLNVKLQLPEPIGIYASSTLIGGFNHKWGLPLPQVPALSAGSVFVFHNTQLTPDQSSVLEAEGIGERRVDGFGRVVVNGLEKVQQFRARPPEVVDSSIHPLDEEFHDLAEQMADKILRQRLEQLLLDQTGRSELRGKDSRNNLNGQSESKLPISNSQLSRLRLVARQALMTDKCELELVRSLLSNLPKNARNQFENTWVGELRLDQQIHEWLDSCNNWRENPRFWISPIPSVQVAGVEQGLTDRLVREYTLRLIMAVAKKATKERN